MLRSAHKNLHRLTSLAFSIESAPASRPIGASALGAKYGGHISKRISVPPGEIDSVLEYLKDRGLADRYIQGVRGVSDLRGVLESGRPAVEYQDWLLSDPSLPSSTGRERELSVVKTIGVAGELQLLADRTLTVAPAGTMIREMAREFGAISGSSRTPNPMDCRPLSYALHLQVLRCDLGFHRALLDHLPVGSFSFRDDIVPLASSILETVDRIVPASSTNRDLVQWIRGQKSKANQLMTRLDKEGRVKGGAARPTLFRPLEDLFLGRLEFLVDVSLLKKPARGRYVYESGPGVSRLSSILDGGAERLAQDYFTDVAVREARAAKKVETQDELLVHLSEAHRRLRGLTKYSSVYETVVLSNFLGWGSAPWVYVEVADALEQLQQLSRGPNPAVRMLSDRYRRPSEFSILEG